MIDETSAQTAASAKADFQSGALWEGIASRRSNDPDTGLEELIVSLHNTGEINFLEGIDQPAFAALPRHQRWWVDGFIGRVTPRLDATWVEMAGFVDRALASLGSANAYEVYEPFVRWCATHPAEALVGVSLADRPGAVPPGHLERVLAGLADADLARKLARTCEDDRRAAAVRALARLDHPTPATRLASLNLCRDVVEGSTDDELLSAVTGVILNGVTRADPALDGDAIAVLDRALTKGGDLTLRQAGFALCTASQDVLSPAVLAVLLSRLSRVRPDQADLMEQLQYGLGRLVEAGRPDEAFRFIRSMVSGEDGAPSLAEFEHVFSSVFMGPAEGVHALALDWWNEGRPELCLGLVDLFQAYDLASSPLTIDFSAHGYTDQQIWFICRRAIGFFLIHEVVAASVVVSALRTASPDLAEALTDLLADPLLMNYQMALRPYLDGLEDEDPAKPHVTGAIARSDAYRAAVGEWDIPELRPSEAQRQLAHTHRADLFKSAEREGRKKSVFADLVHTQTLLYGKRSLSYLVGLDGKRQMFESKLSSFGYSAEMPHQDVLDPVALAMQTYQLRYGGPQ